MDRGTSNEPSPVSLGPFLGHVTPATARVVVRLKAGAPSGEPVLATVHSPSAPPRATQLHASTAAGSAADGRTFAGDVALTLGAGVTHEIRVSRGAAPLGSVHARAAEPPSETGRIAFAFGSCWKPGSVRDADRIWRDLACLARGRIVDHLLLLGDQVYADEELLHRPQGLTASASAWALALGAASPLADRAAPFLAACESAWASRALVEAQAMLPTTLMWDDHEIVNSYGSHDQHFTPDARALFEAASAAFDEVQGTRNPPPLEAGSRAWAFRRGPAAFLALDLRTHRRCSEGRLLGDDQRRAVRAYLEGEALSAPVLFVATSVPPLHLPRIIHAIQGVGDVRDQWEIASKEDRAWLVQRLRDFEEGGRRRAVILGGDAHAASAAYLVDGERRALWQVVSSPLAQALPPLVYPALRLLGRRFGVTAEDGERLNAHIVRRWSGRNFGVVRGSVEDDRIRLTFELYRPGRTTREVELVSPIAR